MATLREICSAEKLRVIIESADFIAVEDDDQWEHASEFWIEGNALIIGTQHFGGLIFGFEELLDSRKASYSSILIVNEQWELTFLKARTIPFR